MGTHGNTYTNYPFPRKYVRALRLTAWNALLIISALILIALVGEMYLRLVNPFIQTQIPFHFVDGVGAIRQPNSELRFANWRDDHWLTTRANSLGFLDREPVSPERAAQGCHIAFIGDSFVEAMEVPIADKFHVRLEEMASRELPHLAITAQAYGVAATGQINQLPFYDEYARRLNPKLIMLVFFFNDFYNNSPALYSLYYGVDPDRLPFMSAQRDASGALNLRPPHPEYERSILPPLPQPWYSKAWQRLIRFSYFAKWMDEKPMNNIWLNDLLGTYDGSDPQPIAWANMIGARPCCSSLLDAQGSLNWAGFTAPFSSEGHLQPVYEEALEYTSFGIAQFKRRADRDGAKLAILSATADMGTQGDPQFDRLIAIAEAHAIPVISDYDYIVRQGYDEENGRWRFDRHWNATGHHWVAEAILEWLKANQDVCD